MTCQRSRSCTALLLPTLTTSHELFGRSTLNLHITSISHCINHVSRQYCSHVIDRDRSRSYGPAKAHHDGGEVHDQGCGPAASRSLERRPCGGPRWAGPV